MDQTFKPVERLDESYDTTSSVPSDMEPRLVWLGLSLAGSCRYHLDLA